MKTEEVPTSVLKMAAVWIPAGAALLAFARLALTVPMTVCVVGAVLAALVVAVAAVSYLAGFRAGEAELDDE